MTGYITGQVTTSPPLNGDDGPSGSDMNKSLVVAVAVSAGVAVLLLVTVCFAYLIYKKQQQRIRR